MEQTEGVAGVEAEGVAQRDEMPQSSAVAAMAATGAMDAEVDAHTPALSILIIGGVMALGWILVIMSFFGGGGGTFFVAMMLMIPGAIYWRAKAGRQMSEKAAEKIKGSIDRSTDQKVMGSHFNQAVDRATGLPGMSSHDGMERGMMRIGGWLTKRWLIALSSFAYCTVRPIPAAIRELRAARGSTIHT